MTIIATLPQPMTFCCLECGEPVLFVDISEDPPPPPLCIECTMAAAPPSLREETAEELRFVWFLRKESGLPPDATMLITVWGEESESGVLMIRSQWAAVEAWPAHASLEHWWTKPAVGDPPFTLVLIAFGAFLEDAPSAVYEALWRWPEPAALPAVRNYLEPGVTVVDVGRLVSACLPIACLGIQHAQRGPKRGGTMYSRGEFLRYWGEARKRCLAAGEEPTTANLLGYLPPMSKRTLLTYKRNWLRRDHDPD